MEPQIFSSVTIDTLVARIADEVIKRLNEDPTKSKEDRLLTPKQTAKMLQVSLPTLYEWTKKGIIKAKRINSRVRYLESDVLAAMENYNKYNRRAA